MSKTKKQRRKKKKYMILSIKEIRMCRFYTYENWPYRGDRLKHIKDDDIFDLVCFKRIHLIKFPLIGRKVDQNLN